MEKSVAVLEKLILEKVNAGLFPSVEYAVVAISQWLEELEHQYIVEQMRSEDA